MTSIWKVTKYSDSDARLPLFRPATSPRNSAHPLEGIRINPPVNQCLLKGSNAQTMRLELEKCQQTGCNHVPREFTSVGAVENALFQYLTMEEMPTCLFQL